MDNGKIVKSDDVRIGLISLIDNKKNVFHGGMSEIVKKMIIKLDHLVKLFI